MCMCAMSVCILWKHRLKWIPLSLYVFFIISHFLPTLFAFRILFALFRQHIHMTIYFCMIYHHACVCVCELLTIIYSPPFYLMIKLFYFIFLVSFVLAYINTYMVLQHSWYVFCGVCKLSVSVLACHSCFLLRFSFWICKNIAQRFECVCA